jgi:4-amino-4-deoxy-L-arabinose transferase-like glycosyltransferase
MSQPPWNRYVRWLLPVIVLLYLVLATLYAIYTPAWQVPDEPAHYNYVRYLAEAHRFPILKPGDYPAAYLEEIKAAHFPPGMSIEPIRYEFHQPPLYYLLAVPLYSLFGGALLPLRLLSVGLGALLLLVVYWTVGELAPNHPFLALGAAAFVAFLPMHLAMTAAVNNDTLAELLLATILLLAIRYLKVETAPLPWGKAAREGQSAPHPGPLPTGERESRLLVLLGITTDLGLVTKTSVYVALPVVLAAIAAQYLWLDRDVSFAKLAKATTTYLLPAAALALPWWLRNVAVYGGLDILGLGRHDQVVVGQLRTAEFVAQHGAGQLLHDFFVTTFHSFWGQFGWMGVLLDQRLYQALAILSALSLAGFLFWAVRAGRCWFTIPAWQRVAGGLLAFSGLLTLASYLWYNTSFLQHQGRYLFPALVPISLAVALGWREALRRDQALPLALLVVLGAISLGLGGGLSTWLLLMLGGTAAALAIRRFLPPAFDPLVHAAPYLLLLPLDLACLFLFVVPQLAV